MSGSEVRKRDTPSPLFFVSVASKELRSSASLLESTLMGILVGVASKGFTGRLCLQKSNWLGPDGFEGVRRTAWRANMVPGAPSFAEPAAGRRKDRAYSTIVLYYILIYCQVDK
jgi:hypothetical protein